MIKYEDLDPRVIDYIVEHWGYYAGPGTPVTDAEVEWIANNNAEPARLSMKFAIDDLLEPIVEALNTTLLAVKRMLTTR